MHPIGRLFWYARLAAQICDIYNVDPRLCPLIPVNDSSRLKPSLKPNLGCCHSLGWARGCAWILRIRFSYLAGLAGASLCQAFGLPQREGAGLALTHHHSHTG